MFYRWVGAVVGLAMMGGAGTANATIKTTPVASGEPSPAAPAALARVAM